MRRLNLKKLSRRNMTIHKYDGPQKGEGYWSFIHRDDELKEIYKRDNLCLKIFRHESASSPNRYVWGRHGDRDNSSNLVEATIVQNLYAMEGLAPRKRL